MRQEIDCGNTGSYQGSLGFKGVIRSIFLISMVNDGSGAQGETLKNTNVDEVEIDNLTIMRNYASGIIEKNNWFEENFGVSENSKIKVRFSALDTSDTLPNLRILFIYEDKTYSNAITSDPKIIQQLKEVEKRER